MIDLKAKNKKVKDISFNCFYWTVMLQDTGMGYVLGYGAGLQPGTYVYMTNNNGSPVSNDGYIVSNFEAKAMSKIVYGYITVKRFINSEWDKMDEIEKERKKSYHKNDYTSETGETFLQELERFAKFAEISNGFSIN